MTLTQTKKILLVITTLAITLLIAACGPADSNSNTDTTKGSEMHFATPDDGNGSMVVPEVLVSDTAKAYAIALNLDANEINATLSIIQNYATDGMTTESYLETLKQKRGGEIPNIGDIVQDRLGANAAQLTRTVVDDNGNTVTKNYRDEIAELSTKYIALAKALKPSDNDLRSVPEISLKGENVILDGDILIKNDGDFANTINLNLIIAESNGEDIGAVFQELRMVAANRGVAGIAPNNGGDGDGSDGDGKICTTGEHDQSNNAYNTNTGDYGGYATRSGSLGYIAADEHRGDDHHGDNHGDDDHHGDNHHGDDDHHGDNDHGDNHHGDDDHGDNHGDNHHASYAPQGDYSIAKAFYSKRRTNLWENGVIRYRWDSNIIPEHKAALTKAMNEWVVATGSDAVQFIDVTNLKNPFEGGAVVDYKTGNANGFGWAIIGTYLDLTRPTELVLDYRNTKKNYAGVYQDSVVEATALHEIGHVLGAWHEHQRYDRDDYIIVTDANKVDRVNYGRVALYNYASGAERKDRVVNGVKLATILFTANGAKNTIGSPNYDVSSIMHYNGFRLKKDVVGCNGEKYLKALNSKNRGVSPYIDVLSPCDGSAVSSWYR